MTKNSRSAVSMADESELLLTRVFAGAALALVDLLTAAAVETGRGRESMVEIDTGTETFTGSEGGGGCGRVYV